MTDVQVGSSLHATANGEGRFKRAATAWLSRYWLAALWSRLTRGRVCIFVFHHFAEGALTTQTAVPLQLLDEILGRLRRDGYQFVPLDEAVRSIGDGSFRESRSVAFTVDDGYSDFRRSAEVFSAHGCPVTMFLTTGFIDGRDWMWWDRIEYICLRASAGRYRFRNNLPEVVFTDARDCSRIELAQRLCDDCRPLSDDEKHRLIRAFGEATGVALPHRPPEQYRALTWDQIRELESATIRFAPHTVTHRLLSRLDDDQAEWEVSESWRRLCDELINPMPILAYPNGKPGDYGEREFRIAAAAGLIAAVTAVPEHAAPSQRNAESGGAGLFSLPRFPAPSDPDHACLAASGFYRIRQWLSRTVEA